MSTFLYSGSTAAENPVLYLLSYLGGEWKRAINEMNAWQNGGDHLCVK
jgi:hypothetical protein